MKTEEMQQEETGTRDRERRLTLFDPKRHANIAGWRQVANGAADVRANPRGLAAAWVTVPIAGKPGDRDRHPPSFPATSSRCSSKISARS